MIEDRITYATGMAFVDYVSTNISNLAYDPEISQGPIKHFMYNDEGRLLQVILMVSVDFSLKINLYSASKSSQPFIGIEVSGAQVVVTQAGMMRNIKSDDLKAEIILFAKALNQHLQEINPKERQVSVSRDSL